MPFLSTCLGPIFGGRYNVYLPKAPLILLTAAASLNLSCFNKKRAWPLPVELQVMLTVYGGRFTGFVDTRGPRYEFQPQEAARLGTLRLRLDTQRGPAASSRPAHLPTGTIIHERGRSIQLLTVPSQESCRSGPRRSI